MDLSERSKAKTHLLATYWLVGVESVCVTGEHECESAEWGVVSQNKAFLHLEKVLPIAYYPDCSSNVSHNN